MKWQIFASDEFLELTEYTREEILGRNCRFLQGPDTDRAVVDQIRDAIAARRDITVQLLNYTKSGMHSVISQIGLHFLHQWESIQSMAGLFNNFCASWSFQEVAAVIHVVASILSDGTFEF